MVVRNIQNFLRTKILIVQSLYVLSFDNVVVLWRYEETGNMHIVYNDMVVYVIQTDTRFLLNPWIEDIEEDVQNEVWQPCFLIA